MKIFKCLKCEARISDQMTACAKCGEPNVRYEHLATKVFKIIGYVILGLICLRVFVAILTEIRDAIND